MPYATPDEVRELILGVDAEDAPDHVLNRYIEYAQQIVIRDISSRVMDETPTGTIDGSNKLFQLENKYLADLDGDGEVGPNDITVKGWKSDGTYDTLQVSRVMSDAGMFELQTAPDSEYTKITVDYAYYQRKVDYELVRLAVQIYSAVLYLIREHSLMPLKFKIGGRKGVEWGYGYTYPTYPFDKFLERYREIISKLTTMTRKTEWTSQTTPQRTPVGEDDP